ncbi:hypothetical protein G6F37_005115 [Rhizopus arrhizus]|nr:hypothetical protein G6F38_003857 [Rhizopus arrhizus]KAG1159193.1 hypothetical protein G6F37_005115 [Rhizopus arrhizus]
MEGEPYISIDDSMMDSNTEKMVDILEESMHADSDRERMNLVQKASEIHQKKTGIPMEYDEHGNIELAAAEAKKCPVIHK